MSHKQTPKRSVSVSEKVTYEILADEPESFAFALKNVDVSVANALRRTMITDIRSTVIDVDTCVFHKNNGRLHNEILKERLRCIPVHCKEDMEMWAKKHYIEVDVRNETDDYVYITTANFKIKRRSRGGEGGGEVAAKEEEEEDEVVSDAERDRIFPKNQFGNYIDFARLGPFIHENIVPETLHFRADFAIKTARENACYSAVSKCSYKNTQDVVLSTEEWNRREQRLREELQQVHHDEEQIEKRVAFEKRDFYHLDAQRFFVPCQFEFIVETVGVFSPLELVLKAFISLQNNCVDFRAKLRDTPETMIFLSGGMKDFSNMENSYDVVFHGVESSLGHILCQRIYDANFDSSAAGESEGKGLEFCCFKKFHPHDDYHVLRLKFREKIDSAEIARLLIDEVVEMAEQFKTLYKMFGGGNGEE
jgi:DNA-directed RNA polymerase subunit L